MKVVMNTSPFIALDRINCLDILPRLFTKVIRPQSVLNELIAGQSVCGGSHSLYHAEWIDTQEDPAEMVLRKELGDGETAVIALALKIKADLVILDDLAARNVATELDLNIAGTLGLLIAAHKKAYLPEIEDKIKKLQASGFHVSDSLLHTVLNQLK